MLKIGVSRQELVKKSIVNDIDIDGYGSPVAPVISSYSPATDDSTVKVKTEEKKIA